MSTALRSFIQLSVPRDNLLLIGSLSKGVKRKKKTTALSRQVHGGREVPATAPGKRRAAAGGAVQREAELLRSKRLA